MIGYYCGRNGFPFQSIGHQFEECKSISLTTRFCSVPLALRFTDISGDLRARDVHHAYYNNQRYSLRKMEVYATHCQLGTAICFLLRSIGDDAGGCRQGDQQWQWLRKRRRQIQFKKKKLYQILLLGLFFRTF